jgi:hypothetical protein
MKSIARELTPTSRGGWAALRILGLSVALVLLPACKSVQFYATRPANMHDDKAPRLQLFQGGEQPAIVVDLPKHCGWGQQVGTVWLDEAISGRTAWHQNQFMRAGSKYYFMPEGLAPGTYLATLRAEGDILASMNFDLRP